MENWKEVTYINQDAYGFILAYLLKKFGLKLMSLSCGGYGKPQYVKYYIEEK